MMGRVVGIDLGTTFSAAATINSAGIPEVLRNADGQNTTPSVVFFEGSDVLVGQQAKAQRYFRAFLYTFFARAAQNTVYRQKPEPSGRFVIAMS